MLLYGREILNKHPAPGHQKLNLQMAKHESAEKVNNKDSFFYPPSS